MKVNITGKVVNYTTVSEHRVKQKLNQLWWSAPLNQRQYQKLWSGFMAQNQPNSKIQQQKTKIAGNKKSFLKNIAEKSAQI